MWSTRVRSVVNHFVKMDSSCNLYAYSRFVLPFSILWNTFSIRERAFLALGAVFRNSLFFQESFMVQVISCSVAESVWISVLCTMST